MTLIIFKHIHSAFQPKDVTYFCRDKCHLLHYCFCMFNAKSKIIFVLGYHGDFGEGGIYTRIRYIVHGCKTRINRTNIEWIFSSCQMPSIISNIILLCTKVIIKQTLTSTYQYTT